MMTNIGQVKSTPKPNAAVATEAMGLLAAMGGGDMNIKKALKEMKEIQTHNETVLASAKDSINEANKRTRDLVKMEVDYKNRMQLDKSEISSARVKLDDDIMAFNNIRAKFRQEQEKERADIEYKRGVLNEIEVNLEKEEGRILKLTEQVKSDRMKLDAQIADSNKRKQELESIFSKLRAILPNK